MKKIVLALLFLLLFGCSTLEPKPHSVLPDQVMVIENQYIIDVNDRSFRAWDELITTISESSHSKLVETNLNFRSSLKPKIVPYEKARDLCYSKFRSTKCSPNYHIQIETNDPHYPLQWGLEKIRSPKAWEITTGSQDIKVAVIDTGVDCAHPDLNCSSTYNVITDKEGEAEDENGHGTHVAGTICALGNNGIGVSGVVHRCSLIAIKFLSPSGGGTMFDAIRGIEYAVNKGARIINASWGSRGYSYALEQAIREAGERGVLFVAAAGNSSTNNDSVPHYPSNFQLSNVVSVASIRPNGAKSSFSNYGLGTVDIAAPGSGIVSTWPNGLYHSLSGTSMATPHVSGLAALLLSNNPNLPVEELREQIVKYSTPTTELKEKIKHGAFIDAYGAIRPKVICDKAEIKKCKKACRKALVGMCKKQRQCGKNCRQRFCR